MSGSREGAGDGAEESGLGYTPLTREVETVRGDAQEISAGLRDVLAVEGTFSQLGPRVATCGQRDARTYFTIHYPWTVTGVPVPQMEQAMRRLKDGLPERGWKVVRYGPDKSPARNLELIADLDDKPRRFSVNVRLHDERESSDAGTSKIFVDLVSACYRVPEGQVVDTY